jgi:hypothetical protein
MTGSSRGSPAAEAVAAPGGAVAQAARNSGAATANATARMRWTSLSAVSCRFPAAKSRTFLDGSQSAIPDFYRLHFRLPREESSE